MQADARLLSAHHFSELANVGAGDEGAASSDDDDSGYRRIGRGGLDRRADAFGHSGAERVDWRIGDRDDGYGILDCGGNEFRHGRQTVYRPEGKSVNGARILTTSDGIIGSRFDRFP